MSSGLNISTYEVTTPLRLRRFPPIFVSITFLSGLCNEQKWGDARRAGGYGNSYFLDVKALDKSYYALLEKQYVKLKTGL